MYIGVVCAHERKTHKGPSCEILLELGLHTAVRFHQCGCWESNSDPQEEQCLLLKTELQLWSFVFLMCMGVLPTRLFVYYLYV